MNGLINQTKTIEETKTATVTSAVTSIQTATKTETMTDRMTVTQISTYVKPTTLTSVWVSTQTIDNVSCPVFLLLVYGQLAENLDCNCRAYHHFDQSLGPDIDGDCYLLVDCNCDCYHHGNPKG